MEKVPYDIWLHWFVTMRCNLDCEYCFENPIKKTATLKPINIKSIMNSLEKSQKIYRISLTGGGEPFLIPNIVEFCMELTQKHYLSINTNLTVPQIKVFAGLVNPDKVTILHASLHIEELFRKKLVDRFIENYHILKSKGINLEVKAVAYPNLKDKVPEYRQFFSNRGIEFQFEPFIGNYCRLNYPDSYTPEEMKAFDIKLENNDIFYQKNMICNAGFNVGIVLPNGMVYSCFRVSKSLGNLNKEIHFANHLTRCPEEKCSCPLNYYDRGLFQRALADKNIKVKTPNRFINYAGLIKMDRSFVKKEY